MTDQPHAPAAPGDHDVIDETYQRLTNTGPEFHGWLSNHGPMAAEALVRMRRPEVVADWVSSYRHRLEPAPATRWRITEDEWPDLVGDPSRLGDWCDFFSRAVDEEPWRDLLSRWWPRLLPGAIASATHGIIRTGHAVRSLLEKETPERRRELAHALGYWAARYQPLPDTGPLSGGLFADGALDLSPVLGATGGIRARLRTLADDSRWPHAVESLAPVTNAADAPAGIDSIVDAAIRRYLSWGQASPVMLVHAATGPRAIGLMLPALPAELWIPSFEVAWKVSSALSSVYRPGRVTSPPEEWRDDSEDEVIDRAVVSGDEHAIKFTEVAQESHRRGNAGALHAALLAVRLIDPQT